MFDYSAEVDGKNVRIYWRGIHVSDGQWSQKSQTIENVTRQVVPGSNIQSYEVLKKLAEKIAQVRS